MAEVVLIYGEVKKALVQIETIVWDKTIKLIRLRAGFTDPAVLNFYGSKSMSMIDRITNEIGSEFALESLRTDNIRKVEDY